MGRTFVELLEEQLGQARARCEHLQAENARLQKALEGCIHEFADITNGELRTDGTSDANLTCDENGACDGIVTTADYDGDLDFGGGPKQGESK